jgi:glucose/arabinose dehydrogenase
MTRSTVLLVLAGAVLALLPPTADAAGDPPAYAGVRAVEAWPGVKFESPIGIRTGARGDDALYVWEQGGRVKRLPKYLGTGPVPKPTLFLDLSTRVFPRVQGGLLGLDFHPQCAQNGRVFVVYLRGEMGKGFELVISELRAQGGVVNPATERVLLRIAKTTAMHNGGWLEFGKDGMLYVSTGDNAKQKEALQTSQNPMSLLGKILRLDVNRAEDGLPYAIPADNPWAGYKQGVRREIFAYGMRNPWQFCFDARGTMWTAQPGTKGPGTRECITPVIAGKNHGWPYFEGTRPMEPMGAGVDAAQFVKPVFEYTRGAEPDMTAAWGGVFYRGSRVPALRGKYVFGDYPRGAVYLLDLSTGRGQGWQTLLKIKGVCRIGEDRDGELYFASLDDGKVFTLVPGT